MVEDGCAADAIPLTNVDAKTLCMIIPYLKKHAAAGDLTRDELNKFDDEFISGESLGDLMDAVLAANYLNIRELIELLATKIAVLIKGYKMEEIRESFNIDADDLLLPAEEEKFRKDYPWAFENLDEA